MSKQWFLGISLIAYATGNVELVLTHIYNDYTYTSYALIDYIISGITAYRVIKE